MQKLLSSLLATLLVGLLSVTSPAYAVTPDGVTPPNEGVCDPLQGGTPGLYGLCVAFCEAQDLSSVAVPTTEEELAALASTAPAGRILANYNKRKQPTDPAMPCIKVEEPCPCWSSSEINDINGVMFNGSTADELSCVNNGASFFVLESQGLNSELFTIAQVAINTSNAGNLLCRYESQDNYGAEGISIRRVLSTGQNSLTPEQYSACEASVQARKAALGPICP
ncbi:MAG: hypothetical protein H8E21_06740 [Gammaproteobacteria bacterium]|nr:hypothetical protein [Gammaproteobacteria bacterium]MBL6985387.1 hypothetical protein [Candidatus Thioglobus sp.]MBL6999638.1 hypothetical protein [Gammaproteobacteria bacterium]